MAAAQVAARIIDPAATDRVVVMGTAGHVDHGKSALVRALTGTDPDRLAEEKARGLTIDLGFAWCPLPGGGSLSLVDVPGHEDFIRNMLAGTGGIDAVLMVIAADEGPMPQTREHLAILDLLGIRHGVVALSKADLVDADWLALVREDVVALLAPTSLAGAPIVPTSVLSGAGLAALIDAIAAAIASLPPAADLGRPRLAVDRSFTLAGFGTVVTGTLRDGCIRPGDSLAILPGGPRVRARGVQSHGQAVDTGRPGTRTAINLVGVDAGEIARGMVVAAPGAYRETQLADVMLRLLPDAPADLAHDAALHVFHGAAEIPAHVRVIGARAITPGAVAPAQLRFDRPTVLVAGDRFVLRQPSPPRTIGGGTVLDPHPAGRRRRFREQVTERFAALATGDPAALVWHMLAAREPCRAEALTAADTGVEPALRDKVLADLEAGGAVLRLGDLWITDTGWQNLQTRMVAVLGRYHSRHPLRVGPPPEELRERSGVSAEAFPAVVDRAGAEGWLVREADALRLPEHGVSFSPAEEAAAAALGARFRADPFKGPSKKEAEAAVGPAVLAALVARGDLVPVSGEVLFDREGYAALYAGVIEHLATHPQITVADLRDRFETSRKYALAFLEHLDRIRVTRRVGDARVRMGASLAVPQAPTAIGG